MTTPRIAKLRAIAQSRADAELVIEEWRSLYGERLQFVNKPGVGRHGEWLVYASVILLDEQKKPCQSKTFNGDKEK